MVHSLHFTGNSTGVTKIKASGNTLNNTLKANMPKIDSTLAGIINGVDHLITGK